MRVTVFTKSALRHQYLVSALAKIADEVFVIKESRTSTKPSNGTIHRSLENYFAEMALVEQQIFSGSAAERFSNVSIKSIEFGSLSTMSLSALSSHLESDLFIIFGSSFIKGRLVQELITRNAINIHMGISPYYRGAACNFWALYDQHPELVGATIHRLSEQIDGGDILYHVFPTGETFLSPNQFTMCAVKDAIDSVTSEIEKGTISRFEPIAQSPGLELRYSFAKEFTASIVESFRNNIQPTVEYSQLATRREIYEEIRPFSARAK